ncbi:MAG: hypothetical protein A2720_00600 [Candidatus Doudnabacteria bacterium RIFCSPHIGHO2_01_FULL_46_24]|uniref:Uncharacterized protein n=1 Tax=Candidatus Doudnabacteria bacterium RIFCSPHIGHO2_01_FULL_46_24 TaxID=1817825 RepID=A0A1F5NW71_9BACT|nr:MAG: hypothetical protein A2720_00600 [Candidatus Doudnabacteria bacterium RIFCSPHIGHO2_01_FULL_46_24]
MGKPSFGAPPSRMAMKPSMPNQPSGPKKLDLRAGAYHDESMFKSGFGYHVEQDLKSGKTASLSPNARWHVAEAFKQSIGGQGITKSEIKTKLQNLLQQNKISESDMWAVRNKYGVF